jgi:hypothetical protein
MARGENLGIDVATDATWYDGKGLYPLQAMVQPIALRFKYHFQGSRNTNRVDKVRHRRQGYAETSRNGHSPTSSTVYTSTKHFWKNTSSP